MHRLEKSAGIERSVYRTRNDLSDTFILLLFDKEIYRKFSASRLP